MKKLILIIVTGLIYNTIFAQLQPPSNLQYTIENQVNVELTWEAPQNSDDIILHYDDGTNADGIAAGLSFAVAIRFEPEQISELDGYYLTQIDFFPHEAEADYTIKVWSGTNADSLLTEQSCSPVQCEWNMITLDLPVLIDANQEFWFGYHIDVTYGYPAGCDDGPAVNGYGDLICSNDTWSSMADVYGLDYNWNIQGHVSERKKGGITKPLAIKNHKYTHTNNLKKISDTNSSKHSKPTKTKRDFIGYNIYRDGFQIAIIDTTQLTYLDEELEPGTYEYEVTAVYDEGESEPTEPVEVEIYVNSSPELLTNNTKLVNNNPNPFNPTTTINFTTKEAGNVNLNIYNIRGQKVKTLVNDNLDAASHSVVWNGKDDNGKAVSSGVYFYKMQAGKYTSTKKMILMK